MNLRFSRKQLGIPYAVFLICFVVAPLLVVLYYAFTNGSGQFTAGNFINFFTDENTIGTLCYSLVVAGNRHSMLHAGGLSGGLYSGAE